MINELGKGKFRPVYYFYGPEEYRIKEAEKEMIRRFLPPALVKTNHTGMSAAKSKVEDILTELSIFPMLGENQAFTISDIQSLHQSHIEKIIGLLKPPDPHRIVIFTSPADKQPGKKTKLFQYLTDNTTPVEFTKLSRPSAEKRLRGIFSKSNVIIDEEALQTLATLSGGDLGGIILEANKLVDFIGEGGKITGAEVAAVSSDYQGFKIYELTEYIARREIDRALSVIDFLVSAGESWSGIMFFVGEHFADLYLVKNNKPLGSKQWLAGRLREQAALFDNEQYEKIIELISEADRDIRGGGGNERTVIEKLIIEIAIQNGGK